MTFTPSFPSIIKYSNMPSEILAEEAENIMAAANRQLAQNTADPAFESWKRSIDNNISNINSHCTFCASNKSNCQCCSCCSDQWILNSESICLGSESICLFHESIRTI